MKEMKKMTMFLFVLAVAMSPAISQAHGGGRGSFHGGRGGSFHGGHGGWYHGPHRSWRGHDVILVNGVWGYWDWNGFEYVWVPAFRI